MSWPGRSYRDVVADTGNPSGDAGGDQPGGNEPGGDQPGGNEPGGDERIGVGPFETPAIPASAGALIFDRKGRLLILKPTYKSGWTIPGGVMEADGETPWEACRREVREECGLDVAHGRLAAVDFRRPRPGRPGGVRFLFDCGVLADAVLSAVVLQPEEVSQYRLASMPTALSLLRGPIRRRVREASRSKAAVYLEEGRPVR
jgi:ADP-ribose pyrophosphatase YjhB (NUDIX family)